MDSFADTGMPYSALRASSTASQVYKDTWHKFYAWKEEQATRDLNLLRVNCPKTLVEGERTNNPSYIIPDHGLDDWSSEFSYPSSYAPSESDLGDSSPHHDAEASFLAFQDVTTTQTSRKVTIQLYNHLPQNLLDTTRDLWQDQSLFTVAKYRVSIDSGFALAESINIDFSPHPPYFSCTSSTRNVPPFTSKEDSVAFSPFEDNLCFDSHRYLIPFLLFDWQTDFVDPDVEVIHLHVARRLFYDKTISRLSFSEIDDLGILTRLRKSHESGLIWDTSQRDLPYWSEAGAQESEVLNLSSLEVMPSDDDLFGHLRIGSRAFCPNLNCLHAACGVHRDSDRPPLRQINATLTSRQIQLLKGNPCGQKCFRHLDLSDYHVMTLRGILDICPDILPCDLAIIVHESCQDVFIYRTQSYPDHAIEDNVVLEENSLLARHVFGFHLVNTKEHAVRTRAVNAFSRDITVSAIAIVTSHALYDGRGVLAFMSQTQERKLVHHLTVRKLDCALQEPLYNDILPKFRGKKSHKRPSCHNVDAQRSKYPHLYISRGSWGLGTFTTQKIAANQAIGEYVGELLTLDSEADTEKVSPIPHYTGLNYKFDLNSTYIIDSMYLGNEMRYLNHDGPTTNEENQNRAGRRPSANCHVVYVNNCHRILFIASELQSTLISAMNDVLTTVPQGRRIEPRSELFIDYGLGYWTEKDEWSGAKEGIYWH
ncbi:hypothetical protein NP233_g6608 [Leucocoprinus birnbaumii]|uniref:SET domain-containing protein n=1 Tax=Leucocoprinus birnbaumii TaxID=56174 RepID=A0AAD5VWA8_9AGAR|nr:hypothetical protein NP233_g6608 [Leucocoprinus birnbaumii]